MRRNASRRTPPRGQQAVGLGSQLYGFFECPATAERGGCDVRRRRNYRFCGLRLGGNGAPELEAKGPAGDEDGGDVEAGGDGVRKRR